MDHTDKQNPDGAVTAEQLTQEFIFQAPSATEEEQRERLNEIIYHDDPPNKNVEKIVNVAVPALFYGVLLTGIVIFAAIIIIFSLACNAPYFWMCIEGW